MAMKTRIPLFLLTALGAALAAVSSPAAQDQPDKGKGPTSKIYLAETSGETRIINHDKLYTPRQATAFDAPGTIIETKADSHDAFVYSNGTGMFVDQNSRVEIGLFTQEPFRGAGDTKAGAAGEPSVSQSNVTVVRGSVSVCSSQLRPGSTMTYTTPQAVIVIRSGRVAIETGNGKTTVDLLDGDATVRSVGQQSGGQTLRTGDRAVILGAPDGQAAAVALSQTPMELQAGLDHNATIACNASR